MDEDNNKENEPPKYNRICQNNKCNNLNRIIEIKESTSGNHDVDKLINDTTRNARFHDNSNNYYNHDDPTLFLQWVPFDKFTDIIEIGEGGFSKVYSAIWTDGKAKYIKDGGSWGKLNPKSMRVALKRLNGSQNMSSEYLNEVNEIKIHWDFCLKDTSYLRFYGMTKDPLTGEFMMIMEFADQGNLRCVLSNNFKDILWKDFGFSGPAGEQKQNNKIYGVLPYIAPEVLSGKPYTLSSDIYSLGVIMAELSCGYPPFYNKKHDLGLALAICNGLRPEFGKGTPEIYKELAYRCMNVNPDQRPTAKELNRRFYSWYGFIENYRNFKDFKEKDTIKTSFEKADKEIPNMPTLYEKDPDAIYTSRVFTFNNLSKPINSPIIASYLNEGSIAFKFISITK